MVRAVLLESNQHVNKWCGAAETLAEVYRYKLHSELDNTSTHFSWYGQSPIIH